MKKVLDKEFFNRPTLMVARDLLGKYVVRRLNDKTTALMIVETEAYSGFEDLASHARMGQTKRNAPMFAEAGTVYVYFTYGMHWMLNIVTGRQGYPAAVLIRGVEALPKKSAKGEMNGSPPPLPDIFVASKLNGPAKLTKFLKIDKRLNTQKLSKKAGLWVEDRGVVVRPKDIKRTPRVGVAYAGSSATKPWRFVLINKKSRA